MEGQNLVYRIETGAAIGKLDVGEHKARVCLSDCLDRLLLRSRYPYDAMSEPLPGSTRAWRSMAISGSSSMITTSVAI